MCLQKLNSLFLAYPSCHSNAVVCIYLCRVFPVIYKNFTIQDKLNKMQYPFDSV